MSNFIREKKIINVNSTDATILKNGTFLSDMTFSFTNIVSQNDDVEYLEGKIESAVFPVSFYIVNYSNNVFNYTILHSGVYTNYSITIPVGNYDYRTLFSAMITLLDTNGHHFDITINEINGITTMFYHSTSGRVFYRINHALSTSFRILGFDVNTDYFPSANTLIAPYPLNLLGIKKLKIFCPQFSSSNLDSSQYSTTTLVATITNDQAPWGQINYYDSSGETGSKLKVFDISSIDVRITDEFGSPINFNNCDWSITFVLNIYRIGEYKALRKLMMSDTNPPEEEIIQKEEQQIEEQPEEVNPDVEDLNFLLRTNPNYFD